MTYGLDEAKIKEGALAYWRKEPRNKPVKLTSVSFEPMFWTEGYITCHKFIAGRTLEEAEQILGFQKGEFGRGAQLHKFLRFPTAEEFDLRGYTQCPDGKAWTPASDYPPGLGAPQWKVRKNSFIPSRIVAVIPPGQTIPLVLAGQR
jgi:hypothetical protein